MIKDVCSILIINKPDKRAETREREREKEREGENKMLS